MMNVSCSPRLPSAFIFLVLFILCLSLHSGLAIKCHNCSSVDDPRCNDPYDTTKLADFLIDCDQVHPEAKFCRKIDQTVNKEQRIFRRCAWEEHRKYNCYFGTSQYYKSEVCICNTDGCNHAAASISSCTLPFILFFLLLIINASIFK